MMKIDAYVSRYLKSNMYIVVEDKHAIIIDPCEEYAVASDLIIDYILLTHEHYDHISGVTFWKKLCDNILCSKKCADNIKNPERNLSKYFGIFCELQTWIPLKEPPSVMPYACSATNWFEKQYQFVWQGHDIKMLEAPGHSEGSCLIYIDQGMVFSGDTLMKNHPIECGLPSGNINEWNEKTVPIIRGLDRNAVIYPGHFEKFNLSECTWMNEVLKKGGNEQ